MASIQKRDNGRWRARYRDRLGTEHARHFARKVDAQAWLDSVTASVVRGDYSDPRRGRQTFDEHFRQWAASQVWAPMTEVQADLVRRSVPFGTVPLAELTEEHLQLWVKHMTAAEYAANTIGTRVMTVRAALKAAVRMRKISADPSVGLSLPRRRRKEAAMMIPTIEQVGSLLGAASPFMRAYIGVGAFAGLRLGEASGLNLADVDFLRRTLSVERQVQKRPGGPPELRAPKYGSERTVYVADELLGLLSAWVAEARLDHGAWLFTGESGSPIPPTTVNNRWVATTKAAKVPGLHFHSLRHFFASGLIADGCDVVTVQRALGHKSPSVTLDTYSHLWPTAEDRTRQAAGRMAAVALSAADSLRTTEGVQGL